MMNLPSRLKALYLPFAYIIVSIVAVPIFAIEAIEAAEFIIAQVEPPSPTPPTPSSVTQAPATTATTPVDADPTCEIGDTTRNELCAQWKAADAATNAVYIGWGQLVVSAVTLLAAFAAAIYARHAAQAAREANSLAKNSDRPWLFVKSSLLAGGASISPGGKTFSISTRLSIRNEGTTVARNIHMRWEAFQTGEPDFEREYERILQHPGVINPSYIAPFRTEHKGDEHRSITLDVRDPNGRVFVAVIVFYQSPHSDEELHTCNFFELYGHLFGTDALTDISSATKMI